MQKENGPDKNEPERGVGMGFVTLILLSVGILLAGWGLMAALNYLLR